VKFLENIPNNDISHMRAGGSNSNTPTNLLNSVNQVNISEPTAGRNPIDSLPNAGAQQASLNQLRADAWLQQQVTRRLQELETAQLGSMSSKQVRRGLNRLGGEGAAALYIEWPHDFVIGGGEKSEGFFIVT
jgi:hypothetical protein